MAMRVHDLRVEHYGDALGVGQASPRLSWRLEGARRGARQTAYQVRAARTAEDLAANRADLWDSGKVASEQSVLVTYEGTPLGSGERAYWTVTVWDENDNPAEADAPCWWETGLLDRSDWLAEWVGADLVGGTLTTVPCPCLRRGFAVEKPVAKARLYATALGLYECRLNGAKVGADELTPGWTDYAKRVYYQTYDVTGQIRQGDNVFGAILGDGWYCGHVEWRGRQRYGDRPRFFAQLVLTYEDGTTQTVATGGDWKYAFGPLVEADLLMGESYDARRELPGWDAPGYDDSAWTPVTTFPDPGVWVDASPGPTVHATERSSRRTRRTKSASGPSPTPCSTSGRTWSANCASGFGARPGPR
jgi:alpha-L-rhamnosidase